MDIRFVLSKEPCPFLPQLNLKKHLTRKEKSNESSWFWRGFHQNKSQEKQYTARIPT